MATESQPADINVQTWVYITFGEITYKLFWYKVSRDGSIYIGIADKTPDYVIRGGIDTQEFLSGTPMLGQQLRRTQSMNISKISFHPSRAIHTDFQKGVIRQNFWKPDERTFLLLMMFRDTYRLSTVTRKKDFTRPSIRLIAADFGIRPDDSLQCAVMVRPTLDNEIESIADARYVQWAKTYSDFTDERKAPMILHFILAGKDADGKEHKRTIFLYPRIKLV